ncbi:LysR family transcriptional regulator [Clostridium nigeriense]|uniref:LysR family transcriptional regulator n=1 Tax=Clostridium nigeriense TaxID=1805470 RepID=UPI003D3529F1
MRVLKYFLTLAREENITKAAETLHITQPTLSRQLAQMEDEMGVTLFVRGTRKITLTHEGLLLRRRAEEILELVDKTEKEITQQNEVIEGTISIGCGDLFAVQILAKIIDSFTVLYPNVNFELYTATADHIRERIDKGLTDIGLLLEPVDLSKYDFIRISHQEKWVVLLPLDSPLAEKESITAYDLIDKPLILPHRLNMQSELANWFGDSFSSLNILFTSNLISNAAVMVHQGLAYAIVIEGSISFWDPKKIKYLPLSPQLTSTTALAWKREQPFTIATAKFIEYAKKFLNV